MSTFIKCTGKWGLDDVYYCDTTNNLWVWKASGGSTYYMSASVGIPKWANGVGTKYYPTGFIYDGTNCYIGYNGLYFWGTYAASVLGVLAGTWYQDVGGGVYKLSGIGTNPVWITWTNAIVGGPLPAPLGYYSSTLLGVYADTNLGATTKWLGWRNFNYSSGKNFVEQKTIYNTKTVALDDSTDARVCWWDSSVSKWIISEVAGTKDIYAGYWMKASGTEPDGTYDRSFTPAGDPPSVAPLPVTYTLALPTYLAGNNVSTMYMGQTTLWL